MKKIRLTYNAPVTLTFVLLCFSATLLNYMTQGVEQCAFVYDVSFVAHQSADIFAVLHACAWT